MLEKNPVGHKIPPNARYTDHATGQTTDQAMHGMINLDKPAGISSARAVARVKRLLPKGTKIGHAGTLDPFATGVLLLLVGRATKLCERLMDQPKQYETTLFLGATTATDDPESPRIVWPSLSESKPSMEDIIPHIQSFKGENEQIPPIFSAIHVKGRRAYDLARQGTPPVLAPRRVNIYEIQIIDYHWPELKLCVDCGRGTYIRALARDIGKALDVGAHLTQLRRTQIGKFNLDSSHFLGDLSAETIESCLIPMEAVVG
jgi:tRNA pseudouridine55 synthase